MCQSSKKEFFKKFLFEPLPVEVRTKRHTSLGKNAKTPKWHFLLCLFGSVPQLKPWGLCSVGREGSVFATISPHLYILPYMQVQRGPMLQQLHSLTAWISVMEFSHVAKTARAEGWRGALNTGKHFAWAPKFWLEATQCHQWQCQWALIRGPGTFLKAWLLVVLMRMNYPPPPQHTHTHISRVLEF